MPTANSMTVICGWTH